MTISPRAPAPLAALLLAASTLVPVVASLLPASRAIRVAGVVDVALAAAILVLAALLDRLARGRIDGDVVHVAYRFYRAFATAPLALLTSFFVVGPAVRWDVWLPGLAWRGAR